MNSQRQIASRLAGRMAYAQVFRHGTRLTVGPLTAKVLPGDEPRLGFAISRRYGNAVKRNLLKRRIRAAFNASIETLPAVSAVISPSFGSKQIGYKEVQLFMDRLANDDR